MRDLIEFFLHLAFGGFLFLCLLYVLQVVFFLSKDDSPAVRGEHLPVGDRIEPVLPQAHCAPDTHTETMEADTVRFSESVLANLDTSPSNVEQPC